MATKRKFTEAEYKQLEGMAAIRLPNDQIATLMGFGSLQTYERHLKKDAEARDRIASGRASASGKVRNTLYTMATSGKSKDQFQALKWWTQTQEGFKSADSIEITGADGGPVKIKSMSKLEVEMAAKMMAKKLALCDDE